MDLTSFGDKARIRTRRSLREKKKVRTTGEPVHGYFLYVNHQQVPKVFMTLEEAKEEAKSHLQNEAALQIKTTWGLVRTWNYKYDMKQWMEMVRG